MGSSIRTIHLRWSQRPLFYSWRGKDPLPLHLNRPVPIEPVFSPPPAPNEIRTPPSSERVLLPRDPRRYPCTYLRAPLRRDSRRGTVRGRGGRWMIGVSRHRRWDSPLQWRLRGWGRRQVTTETKTVTGKTEGIPSENKGPGTTHGPEPNRRWGTLTKS